MIKDVNGVLYHFEIIGNGPPLLLLHGFTGDLRQWQPFIQEWQKIFTCIAVDIIGHGQTKAPDDVTYFQMDGVADQIVGLLHSINVENVNIVGYSMGGRLALTIADRYPSLVNAMLLEGASPGLATDIERNERIQKDKLLAEKIISEGINEFVAYWENLPLFSSQKRLSDSVLDSLREQRLRNNPKGLANSLYGMGTGSQRSLWEVLKSMSIPTLLVTGAFDKKFTHIAKEMTSRLSNSTMEVVLDAGHTVHLEKPTVFDKIVREQFYPIVQKGMGNFGD